MEKEYLHRVTGAPAGELLINEVNLGDIVTLISGEELTIRAIGNFGKEVKGFTGFIVLGECKYILALKNGKKAELYKSSIPIELHKATRLIIEGSVKYWSNHLPGIDGSMGELQFRMLEVPGNLLPWYYLYRGPERILFKPDTTLDLDGLKIMFMPRSSEQITNVVVRHAVTITPLTIELPFEIEPVEVPEKEFESV